MTNALEQEVAQVLRLPIPSRSFEDALLPSLEFSAAWVGSAPLHRGRGRALWVIGGLAGAVGAGATLYGISRRLRHSDVA